MEGVVEETRTAKIGGIVDIGRVNGRVQRVRRGRKTGQTENGE